MEECNGAQFCNRADECNWADESGEINYCDRIIDVFIDNPDHAPNDDNSLVPVLNTNFRSMSWVKADISTRLNMQ